MNQRKAGGRVVDLGCGSGILAERLTNAGYRVLGVDISPAMIALARRVAPAAQFRTGSLLSTTIPKCSAVVAIGEGLNYGSYRSRTPPKLQSLFRRIYRALEPGGVFVFDVVVEPLNRATAPTHHHLEGSDWCVLMESDYSRTRNRLRRKITVFRRRGRSYRRSDEVHVVWLYDRATIARQLRDSRFKVRTTRRYGDRPLLPSRVALVARKPPFGGKESGVC